MSKTVERATTRAQWEKLRYPVKLSPLSDEEGGGYLASIPLLGEATCVADGETVEEALANLEEYRRSMFPLVAKSRQPIPLPPSRADETSSAATARPAGKWLMRATPEIQAALQEDAAREGVSFNTFCLICLERGRSVHAVEEAARETSRQLHQLQSVLCAEIRQEARAQTRSLSTR